MAKKIYDVAVATGKYTNQQGEEKNRYENIGVVMQGDNGPFLLLKRTFNPAGIHSDRESIVCSLFKPDGQAQAAPQQAAPAPKPAYDASDEIPF